MIIVCSILNLDIITCVLLQFFGGHYSARRSEIQVFGYIHYKRTLVIYLVKTEKLPSRELLCETLYSAVFDIDKQQIQLLRFGSSSHV